MRHLHIGLDFDGVISDCGQLKSEAARRMFGVEILPENFKKELVVNAGLLTMDQYRDLQQRIYGTEEFGMLAEPVPEAKEHLAKLAADGHRVRIITTRDGQTLEVAKKWCAKHGLELDFTGVGFGVTKAAAAEGCHLYCDDDLDKLQPLVGVVPNLYLFSWGYNRHADPTGVAHRIASWPDLYAVISEIASE